MESRVTTLFQSYNTPEEREDIIVKLIVEQNAQFVEQNAQFKALSDALTRHIEAETSALESVKNAFPEGDMARHRIYHDALIKQAERRERLQNAIIEKSLAALIVMGICALGGLLWAGIINKLPTR